MLLHLYYNKAVRLVGMLLYDAGSSKEAEIRQSAEVKFTCEGSRLSSQSQTGEAWRCAGGRVGESIDKARHLCRLGYLGSWN